MNRGVGGARGAYYQQRLEWRSWLTGGCYGAARSQLEPFGSNDNFPKFKILPSLGNKLVFGYSTPGDYPHTHLHLPTLAYFRVCGQSRTLWANPPFLGDLNNTQRELRFLPSKGA